ncbi:unnamed protein product [Chrysoparadoxa australica]
MNSRIDGKPQPCEPGTPRGEERGSVFSHDPGKNYLPTPQEKGNSKAKVSGKRKGSRGGLSQKTLDIVTNLETHKKGVGTRQELADLEEDLKMAAEEKSRLRGGAGQSVDHTIKILLLGDSGVGKTSLMMRYSEDKFAPNLMSTAGVDFKIRHLRIRDKNVRCQIWDTAGQEKFHVITRAFYRGVHGIALVYDVTDEDSFKNVNYWMANIATHAEGRISIILLGNKVDLPKGLQVVDNTAITEVAEEFGIRPFLVSAKEGLRVSEAFYFLGEDIVERYVWMY